MTRSPRRGDGREALLDAAVRVVDRDGMRGLTYRAVAEQAGVSHGLVRHHFGSRAALLQAAAVRYATRSLEVTGLESGTGRLEDFGAGTTRFLTDPELFAGFDYEVVLEARRRPELRPVVRALYDRYFEATRSELRRIGFDGEDEPLVRLVFAALDGIVVQLLQGGSAEDADAAVAVLREMLAERLRTRGG